MSRVKNSAGRSLAAAAAASTSQMLCGSGAGEALGSAWGFSCGSAGAGVAPSARTDIGPAAPTAPRIADRSTFARNSEADEARTFVRSKVGQFYTHMYCANSNVAGLPSRKVADLDRPR